MSHSNNHMRRFAAHECLRRFSARASGLAFGLALAVRPVGSAETLRGTLVTALEAVGPQYAYLRGSRIYTALGPRLVHTKMASSARSQVGGAIAVGKITAPIT